MRKWRHRIENWQGIAVRETFATAGIPRVYLQCLRDEGWLVPTGCGAYQIPDAEFLPTVWPRPRASCRGASFAVFSSLQYHGLTTHPRMVAGQVVRDQSERARPTDACDQEQ
jgi:hypothetical protein